MSLNPTGIEQEMLELLNRMRMNPLPELGLMTDNVATTPAHSANAEINAALSFFKVSGPTLASQWSQLVAAPPLAWNEALYNAAAGHDQQMIQADLQDHQVPGEASLGTRVQNAGYTNFQLVGENIFAFGESAFGSHAAFAIDWGFTPTGIQDPPGHRNNMMNATFREVGIAIVPESNPGTHDAAGIEVGPLVITEDFGNRFNFGNPFLLGVVYRDTDGDSQYDAGEGLGGVNVHVAGSDMSFDTTTMTAGGWQLQAPAGTYSVTFSGGALGGPSTVSNVTVGTANTKVDLRAPTTPTPPPPPTFTNDPLVVGSTPVSVVHVQELRTAINTLRTSNGLTAFSFDDVLVAGVTPVRAVHLQQLRQAVNEVFTHAGVAAPTYTDPVIVAGTTVVKAAHIQELRTAARGPQGSSSGITIAASDVDASVAMTSSTPPSAGTEIDARAETPAPPGSTAERPIPDGLASLVNQVSTITDGASYAGDGLAVPDHDVAGDSTGGDAWRSPFFWIRWSVTDDAAREGDPGTSLELVRALDPVVSDAMPDPIVPVLVRRY